MKLQHFFLGRAVVFSILCIGLLFYFLFLSRSHKTPKIATKTYETQEECQQATQKTCAIIMCDLIPAGMTFEEACGIGFKPGWAPLR